MIKCWKCGKEGVTAWQPHRCEPSARSDRPQTSGKPSQGPAAPGEPSADWILPSRRTPGKGDQHTSKPAAPLRSEPSRPSQAPSQNTPDTAPSATDPPPQAAPEVPHSNAQSPSRRKLGKAPTQAAPPSEPDSAAPIPPAISAAAHTRLSSHDTPHTAPSIAPPGECPYCDRRRAAVAASVRLHRSRRKATPT